MLASLPPPQEPGDADWPGVDDPDALRALVARWLAGYGSAGTRRTYAYALGLPVSWADAVTGAEPGDTGGARPPAAPRGRLHHLAWFRWCAARALDPRRATGAHVTAWLHALDAAGARPRTRARMLSTVAALYADLVEQGAVAGNPAALNRSRLGLSGASREPSPTIRLTAAQVRALVDAAATLPDRTRHAELYRRRAVAVVALLTLGLRVSEVTTLDRDDVVVTGGERVLRVLGKGGRRREVYLPAPAAAAVDAYLAHRSPDTRPIHRGRSGPGEPLITRRDGTRCTRFGLYALLRRVAAHAGPELDGVADRVHPHALRHAYVTIALEHDARLQHVQADVGHASVATTQHYDRGLRRRAASAADVVSEAIHGTDALPRRE
ncbi:site-specific recombinase XerD [Pseudonocardia endophytica]|uniref:Site-specific recombinase XerD n=1 Tax=Pseudonocardia endophytica TaxID=401976 RepID=A0A4R1HUJ8_PSEEN|nr:site-specific recombinase XerD [Pseudonocardia endophytica]